MKVSIIMPVWNRESLVAQAIQSVLAQDYAEWELLIVDDGSTDKTWEVIQSFQDSRIRAWQCPHLGVSAARNFALQQAQGQAVAYLDSDCTWRPDYLSTVVQGLEQAECVFLDQEIDGLEVKTGPFDRAKLLCGNYIDLNVFAHRRELVANFGRFDERLTRLVDWDLILRYTVSDPAQYIPRIGARYGTGPDRISRKESLWRNRYLILRKWERRPAKPLRVLYALWHYPQLSEAYVRWELLSARRRGVKIVVWSELPAAAAPFSSEVLVCHGDLGETIRTYRPHVVHTHWLTSALQYADVCARENVPMTVRGHGFDFSVENVGRLQKHPAIRRIWLFPHQARQVQGLDKVRPASIYFNGDLHYPGPKDKQLVVRAGGGLPTKDYPTFLHVAKLCPNHRFALCLARCNKWERFPDEIAALNRSLGNPVDLRVNVQAEEVAELMRHAGIYLHTHGLNAPYGMPISLAEAPACGCWPVYRDCPESREFLGPVGTPYNTAEEAAAIIRETETWSGDRWRAASLAAVEYAYENFSDDAGPLLSEWEQIAG